MVYNYYPIVGIGANVSDDSPEAQNIRESYVDAVYSVGCLPVVIPLPGISLKREYEALASRAIGLVDGLLLSGGGDMDANIFGEENMPYNGSFSEERDLFEIALTKSAVGMKKPILGICRGMQVLNVAMGGTLYQDIERQHGGKKILMHRQKAPAHSAVHSVRCGIGTKIAAISLDEGPLAIGTNSFHHQAVRNVAPGFAASANTSDGITEAMEPAAGSEIIHPFTIGVQWHPELMWKHHAHAKRLFLAFAEACVKTI
jgi:putative glutamine amidotransferase